MITKSLETFSKELNWRLTPSMLARLEREKQRSHNPIATILRRAVEGYLKPIEARENRKAPARSSQDQ